MKTQGAAGAKWPYIQAILVQGFGAALGFVSNIVFARALGDQFFGILGTIVTLSNLLGLLGTMGLGLLGLRLLASGSDQGSSVSAKEFIGLSYLLTALAGASIGIVAFVGAGRVFGFTLGESLLIGALITLTSLSTLGSDLGRGINRFLYTYGAAMVLRPALALSIALIYCFAFGRAGLSQILLSLTIGAGVAAAIQLIVILKTRGARVPDKGAKSTPLVRSALIFLLPNLVVAAMLQADVVVVAGILDPKSLSYYFAASKTVALLSVLTGGITAIAAARISKASAGDRRELEIESQRVTLWSFLVVVLGSIPILLCGRWILGFFGEDFGAAYLPLLVLVAGRVLYAFFGPTGTVLIYTGNPGLATVGYLVCIPLILISSALGASLHGLIGAACGAALGQLLAGGILWTLTMKQTGLNVSIFSRRS